MPSDPKTDDFYFSRTQRFDVVLMKKGVSGMDAKSEDFKRVSITADSVADAEGHEQVVKAKKEGGDWVVYRTTAPGYTTEFEIDAKRREHDVAHGTQDRSKF